MRQYSMLMLAILCIIMFFKRKDVVDAVIRFNDVFAPSTDRARRVQEMFGGVLLLAMAAFCLAAFCGLIPLSEGTKQFVIPADR